MSWLSRFANVFRSGRVSREVDEELESHIQEAVEQGRSAEEARRAFGSPLQQREASRDVRTIAWLDSLRADLVFGWRQLNKKKATSGAAILSLGLALGACMAAFGLVDALLWRPLPIKDPHRLYSFGFEDMGEDGKLHIGQSSSYPMFREMAEAVRDQADLIGNDYVGLSGLVYGGQPVERAYVQHVSGIMFDSFGLRPAVGRLLVGYDDAAPGISAVAVLSYDYWTRRFGRDPGVVGRGFRILGDPYTIVGVAGEGFTGTETGKVVDVFLPVMMNARAVPAAEWNWLRTLVKLKPGASPDRVREQLNAVLRAFRQTQVNQHPELPTSMREKLLSPRAVLESAASGLSDMQKLYRRALAILSVLVGLVLLIACANVANLMTAQAAARAREMALRVSIGAGRARLVQLVLVESAMLASGAAAIGGVFAWWAAPFVVSRINPPDDPARLMLSADWRVAGFGLVLVFVVTLLFGLAAALRASAVQPASALKGGDDPHSRRRLMHALIAVQSAFCFLVLFVAGLFAATLDRVMHQPLGFAAERLLLLNVSALQPPPLAVWNQMIARLRELPEVEGAALAIWPLLRGEGWNSPIAVDGGPPSESSPNFLGISPGWLNAMKIPLLGGRDFRAEDTYPHVAIVNQSFVRRYFNSGNPLGRRFEILRGDGRRDAVEIVGLAGDAQYSDLHAPLGPGAYFPFAGEGSNSDAASFVAPGTVVVRTARANPLALATLLRQEISRMAPELRVTDIHTQEDFILGMTIRERLLAMLAGFFAVVALLLAGVGLYGVLDYSVFQRRREFGIRMAIGARAGDITRLVTAEASVMVLVGASAGLGLGMASARYVETLLFQTKATETGVVAWPSFAMVAVAVLAALAPVIRAVRIDPVAMLRAD